MGSTGEEIQTTEDKYRINWQALESKDTGAMAQ